MSKEIRKFPTGATRDSDKDKFDYEGFLSPLVLHRYAAYLHKHRVQTDGEMRASDNWQKGMSIGTYMKSHLRHLLDIWLIYRGYLVYKERTDDGEKTHVFSLNHSESIPKSWKLIDIEDALCGDIFNAMGHLFELLKRENGKL